MRGLSTRNLYGVRRIQSRMLAAFTLLILLLYNGSAWWIYLRVEGYLDSIFQRSLEESSEIAALAVARSVDLAQLVPEENSLSYIETQTLLARLQQAGNFTDLFLIDPAYRNLVGVYSDFRPGQVDGLLTLDRAYLNQASLGRPALTPVVETGGLFLRTAYVPVFGQNQTIKAILVAKADVEFLKPKIAIRNMLAAITVASGLIILALAFVYARWMRALQRAEARIVHNERLAGLGQLAAGIAHELRNPLGIIEQTMTVLRRRYEKEQDELFDYIPGEVERMNGIITQFLDSARESPLEIVPNDLAVVLDRTLALLDPRLQKGGVELQKAYPGSVPVAMDPNKMQQVFLNLCINAIEAMPDGGLLKVRVAPDSDAAWLCVTVEDTGEGLSEVDVERVFDPFYTTKSSGTGLGLWVADQIVRRHGGRIEAEGAGGRGTRMRVFLRTAAE